MNRLVREFDFSTEQLHRVRELARALSLTETTASLLYARGMDTEEKMRAFLFPSKDHFLSPFLMRGMREAVELLRRARDEEWRVAVFGDYDADGIGACAILSRALSRFGIEPYLFVPERTEGYGMSVAAIDRIFDDFLPDLIVTVDCGISNAREVEYIKEQGAYVIVTDHHELPETLPDCIVVNPKLKDDYPYDNLCGAGVAFKLACALLGEEAYDLVDFAALSTVADSVPLLGENRDIVAEGLRSIARRPRPVFSALLGDPAEVTAQTLAFTVAPRVNAAGRMGDAHAALRFFTTEREEEIPLLAEKLNLYNAERQRRCDELYAQVFEEVRKEGAFGNIVMLAGENWEAGFLGIVAARIAEEFSRPAILFVRHGDRMRGSGRSIESVNLFEALKACSEHIEEFGGHAQAAGVNIRADEFGALKDALDAYIGSRYAREDFCRTLCVCGEGQSGAALAREINRLEPFGIGNRRPMFTFEAGSLDASLLKPRSPHVSFSAGGIDFMDFGGAKDLRLLRSDVKKTLVFEYNLSHFRGRESVKGFVRAVLAEDTGGRGAGLDAFENRLCALGPSGGVSALTAEETDRLIAQRRASCDYGLCVVCFDAESLRRFPAAAGLPAEVFRLSSASASNTVLFAPEADCDLSGFRDVVVLDAPSFGGETGRADVAVCKDRGGRWTQGLDLTRESLLEIFAEVRRFPPAGETLAELAKGCGGTFSEEERLFALAVFRELGLVSLTEGRLRVFRGIKTELTQSAVYNAALRAREE